MKQLFILFILLSQIVIAACIEKDPFDDTQVTFNSPCDWNQVSTDEYKLVGSDQIGEIPLQYQDQWLTANYGIQVNGEFPSAISMSGDSLSFGEFKNIDLKTYNGAITINSDGSATFEPKLNSKGLDGLKTEDEKTKVDKAKTLENEPTPTQPKITAEGVTNAEIEPDEWYMETAKSVTVSDSTTSITVSSVQGFRMNTKGGKTTISMEHFEDGNIGNSNLVDVNQFLTGLDVGYSFDSASEFNLGQFHFRNLCKSDFEVTGSALVRAKLCSDIDNNVFTLPSPIPQIGNWISITANKTKRIDIEYTKLVIEDNVPKIAMQFLLDKDVNMNFTTTGMPNIKVNAKENQANLLIVQDGVTNFEFNDIELECNQQDFSETVDTTKKSKAGLNMQECLGYVILSPTSSPGGRYTYDDKIIKMRSFGFYNPGTEPYEIGFRKTQQFFDWREFEKVKDGYSFGWVDFTNHTFNLNGIIEFLKYPDKPDEVTEADYMQFPQSFMKTIFYSENNNSVEVRFDPNLVMVKEISLVNSEPKATIRNGIFEIHEERYLIPVFAPQFPEKIELYFSSSYGPRITIKDQTLNMGKVRVHKFDSPGAKDVVKDTYTIMSLGDWLDK